MADPPIRLDAPKVAEMTAFYRPREKALAVHLLNLPFSSTRPPVPGAAIHVLDEVVPLTDLKLRVRSLTPSRVTIPLSGLELDAEKDGDDLVVTIPRVELHEVVMLEGVKKPEWASTI